MNFEITATLLDLLAPYVEQSDISVYAQNMDLPCGYHKSDYVIIDKRNHVGFEILEKEIIVFYFTGHRHFKDNPSEAKNGNSTYVQRATAFLMDLFTQRIRHLEYYKGNTLYSEKYFILYSDKKDSKCIENTHFAKFINIFKKRRKESTTWQFDPTYGVFTTTQPRNYNPNAIEIVDLNESCYVEIFSNNDTYYYVISEVLSDKHLGMFYWSASKPSKPYATKEEAIKTAVDSMHFVKKS